MQIKNEKPPALVWDGCHELFDIDDARTVYTYDGTLYNPASEIIDHALMMHEQTHAQQQQETLGGPDAWWKKYFDDPIFRVNQEAEAYGNQFFAYCEYQHDRNARTRYLHAIASNLASGMYKVNLSLSDAKKAILKNSK